MSTSAQSNQEIESDELGAAVGTLVALQELTRSTFPDQDAAAFSILVRVCVEDVGRCVERAQAHHGHGAGYFLDALPQSAVPAPAAACGDPAASVAQDRKALLEEFLRTRCAPLGPDQWRANFNVLFVAWREFFLSRGASAGGIADFKGLMTQCGHDVGFWRVASAEPVGTELLGSTNP